ncbi:signal peptidase II [Chlamydiota bacterium]
MKKEKKNSNNTFFLFSIIFAIVILDQYSKYLIIKWLAPGEIVPIIKTFFNVTYITNKGIIFGFFSLYPHFFLILSAITLIFLTCFILMQKEKSFCFTLSFGLLMGGALGNVSDRIRWGGVVDFLDFYYKSWHWPAFNCADAAITIGIVLLLIYSFTKRLCSFIAKK